MSSLGYDLFVRERRKALGEGEEEPDWEDEWDDLILREQSEYLARAQEMAAAKAAKAAAAALPAEVKPPKPSPVLARAPSDDQATAGVKRKDSDSPKPSGSTSGSWKIPKMKAKEEAGASWKSAPPKSGLSAPPTSLGTKKPLAGQPQARRPAAERPRTPP